MGASWFLGVGSIAVTPDFFMNSRKPHIFFLFINLFALSITAQVVPQPSFSTFEPATFRDGQFYYNTRSYYNEASSNSQSMGGSAEDIVRNAQLNGQKHMGFPSINPQKQALSEYQLEIIREKEKHLLEVMNEIRREEYKRSNATPIDNTAILADYKKAFQQINNMLAGKSKLSLIDALYATESAYGNPYMNQTEFKGNFQQSATFIKRWLKQQNMPLSPENLHYAVQRFMSDTLKINITLADKTQGTQTITHLPFKYDYEDYDGKQDYRNYYSTKCLATGTGQCNSLPEVYLGLCESLGLRAYLTFAPFHSFIKYKDKNGKIANYEPTSNWDLPDKWYQENLGVNRKAKENGIYLDTLNKKQTVANCLVDMAIAYMRKTSNPDTNFVKQCLSTAPLGLYQ